MPLLLAYGQQMKITERTQRVLNSEKQNIPRVVYSVNSKNKVRRAHLNSIEEFRDQNPEYRFEILDDSDGHDFLSSNFKGEKIVDVYERSMYGPMRADILRVALMLRLGGVYIDITKRLSTPLSKLFPLETTFVFAHERNAIPTKLEIETDPLVCKNDRNLIVNWCMMSVPENPIFETMVELIEKDSHKYERVVFDNPKHAILELTGPYQYTKAVWRHLGRGGGSFHYAGIDFGETEYPLIKGSFSRNPFKPHYASIANAAILKDSRLVDECK